MKKGLKLITHKEFHEELLANKPGYKEAFLALEPHFKIIDALIRARNEKKITRKEYLRKMRVMDEAISEFKSLDSEQISDLSTIGKILKSLNLVFTVKPARG